MDDVRGAEVFRDVDDCVVTHRHPVVDDSATTVGRRRRLDDDTRRDASDDDIFGYSPQWATRVKSSSLRVAPRVTATTTHE
jgi:hypothetical protein